MDGSTTYNVIATGDIQSGFDLTQVQEAFAGLFKASPEKAAQIVGTRKVIKKDLTHDLAQAYKKKLESIGLVVTLKEIAAPVEPPKPAFELALEPTEEELNAASENAERPVQNSAITQKPANDGSIVCPKCSTRQPRTEQCTSCGVFIHKVQAQLSTESSTLDSVSAPDQPIEDESDDAIGTEDLTPKVLGAAAAAGLVGAFLWMFIATAFGYELGLIAWAIGGAVGFAAASMGGRGQQVGIACAVITVAAIMGGKYLAMDSLQADFQALLFEEVSEQEFRDIYEEEMFDAEAFATTATDSASIKRFMVDHNYTIETDPAMVSSEEVDFFREEVAPSLRSHAASEPTFSEWMNQNVESALGDVSTWDLVLESFEFIDVLFLLFGVATAFKLGSRIES